MTMTTTSPITLEKAVEWLTDDTAQLHWNTTAEAYMVDHLVDYIADLTEIDGTKFLGPYLAADGRVSVDVFLGESEDDWPFENVEVGRVDLDEVLRKAAEGQAKWRTKHLWNEGEIIATATADHIYAAFVAERKGENQFAVDPDTLAVIKPGAFGYDAAITVWVD